MWTNNIMKVVIESQPVGQRIILDRKDLRDLEFINDF